MMKNLIAYFLYFTLIIGGFSCTKKTVELDVSQDGCNKFKIDGASYDILAEPCDSSTKNLLFDVSFKYIGDSACLHKIECRPEFYNKDNQLITSGITYVSTIEKTDFYINDGFVTFTYDVTFSDIAVANDFNYMLLTFNTENVLGSKSPEAKIRLFTSCTEVTSNMYTVNTDTVVTIDPLSSTFNINLWDHAAEDGDRVSIYLNGTWIIVNHSLLNEPGTNFAISTTYLNKGSNDLVVFALNQGTSGPNTASIAINGGEIKQFDPDLKTGEAVQLKF